VKFPSSQLNTNSVDVRWLIVCVSIAAVSLTFVFFETAREPDEVHWHSWVFVEWLINYEGGFIRRGLAGEFLTRFFAGSEVWFLNWFTFCLAVAYSLLVLGLIWRNSGFRREDVLYLAAPSGGVFWIGWGGEYYYRKEIVFFVCILIAAHLYMAGRTSRSRYLDGTLAGVVLGLCAVLPFIHEAFIFYGGLFLTVLTYNVSARYLSRERARAVAAVFVATNLTLFVLICLNHGSVAQSDAIWNSIPVKTRSLILDDYQHSAIGALAWTLQDEMRMTGNAFISGYGFFYVWALALLGVLCAYIYGRKHEMPMREVLGDFRFCMNFALVMLSFVPLFFLGIDWGRWTFGIFFIFTVQVYSHALIEPDALPGLLRLSACLQRPHIKEALLFAALLVTALWTQVPECCISIYPAPFALHIMAPELFRHHSAGATPKPAGPGRQRSGNSIKIPSKADTAQRVPQLIPRPRAAGTAGSLQAPEPISPDRRQIVPQVPAGGGMPL
jgi:hypothetical protein